MKKKRRKNISVLLIPDDKTDPITFKMSFKMVKVLMVIAVIISIHLLMGIVFYWKYGMVYSENKKLNLINSQLKESNRKIHKIAAKFAELERYQEKITNALGINQGFEISDRTVALPEKPLSSGGKYPTVQTATDIKIDQLLKTKGKLDFLIVNRSEYHDFAKNLPTLLPVEGFLTSDFRKMTWFIPDSHLGVDIAAKRGAIVRAAGSGVVVFSSWTPELGNLVIIYHGGGFFSFYGHNQRNLKSERSFVKKGEPIALLGSSGESSGPHLHFEIWKDGNPVDPKDYITTFLNF